MIKVLLQFQMKVIGGSIGRSILAPRRMLLGECPEILGNQHKPGGKETGGDAQRTLMTAMGLPQPYGEELERDKIVRIAPLYTECGSKPSISTLDLSKMVAILFLR